ncbi:MAG: hypothetical protein PVI09_16035 [Anaerolineae bacterium]|jgi:hypothetical protein
MAKKSRRARRAARRSRAVRLTEPAQSLEAETEAQTVDFSNEYHYVVEDLKRIGIIAAALLVLLIVLAFAFA